VTHSAFATFMRQNRPSKEDHALRFFRACFAILFLDSCFRLLGFKARRTGFGYWQSTAHKGDRHVY
jgi:hypothetical protein